MNARERSRTEANAADCMERMGTYLNAANCNRRKKPVSVYTNYQFPLFSAGCHFKKEYVEIRKTIEEESHDCYPTTPVLRCLDECRATKTRTTLFPMTCVKTGSKESNRIFKDMEKRTLDLTGSDVYFRENLSEDTECDCSVCGQ